MPVRENHTYGVNKFSTKNLCTDGPVRYLFQIGSHIPIIEGSTLTYILIWLRESYIMNNYIDKSEVLPTKDTIGRHNSMKFQTSLLILKPILSNTLHSIKD